MAVRRSSESGVRDSNRDLRFTISRVWDTLFAMMGKTRLEAFSDAVIAILLTIMVLELKAPHETDLAALRPLIPTFLAYVLSFVFLGVYWNNHHHMVHTVHRVTGAILWANLHLMFWLSLVPFTTHWMGENWHASTPTALYAFDLLMCGVAYWILQSTILKAEGPDSLLKRAIGRDFKGKMSPVFYISAFFLAFVAPWIAQVLFVAMSLMWLVPDRRIERALAVDETRH